MPRRPAAATFSSSSLSVSSSGPSNPSISRSINNVYIKGLPSNCTEEGLIDWATSTVAAPASAKTIKDYSGVANRADLDNDHAHVPCSGIGFVKFYIHEDALAFIDKVRGEKGMQACLAKETMQGQMERASDPSSTNLYISHLPLHFTEQDILSLFPPPIYRVASIRLLKTGDQPGRRSRDPNPQFKGAAFARFETREMAMHAIAQYNGKHLVDHHESDRKQTLQLRFADSETQKQLKKQEKCASSLSLPSSSALQIRQPQHRIIISKDASRYNEEYLDEEQKKPQVADRRRIEYSDSASSSRTTSPIMHLGPFPVSTFAPPPSHSGTSHLLSSTTLPPIPHSPLSYTSADPYQPSPAFPSFSPILPTSSQIWPTGPRPDHHAGDHSSVNLRSNVYGPGSYTTFPPLALLDPFRPQTHDAPFTSAITYPLPPALPSSNNVEPIQSIMSSAAAAEKAAQAAAYLQEYLANLGYTKDAISTIPPFRSLAPGNALAFPPASSLSSPPSFPSSSTSAVGPLSNIFPSLSIYPNYSPADGTRDTSKLGNKDKSLQPSVLEAESKRNIELQREIEALQLQHKNLIDQTRVLQAKMLDNGQSSQVQELHQDRSVSPSVALNAYRFGSSWQDSTTDDFEVKLENEETSPLSTPATARTRSMTAFQIPSTKSASSSLLPPASALARRSSAFEARDSKALQEQQSKASAGSAGRRDSITSETYGTERRASIYIPPHARGGSAYTTPSSSTRGSLSSDTQSTRRGSLGTAFSTPASVADTSTAFFERRKSLSPEVPVAGLPPPGLEHVVPKEKIILPFDKALRSFSTTGLETYAFKASNAMKDTAFASVENDTQQEEEEAQKKVDLVKDFFSRRGSQQVPLISAEPHITHSKQNLESGNSRNATAGAKRAGITRRNSSFLKLKNSCESVKELNEAPSPVNRVFPVDPRLQRAGPAHSQENEVSSLTQIRPHFTFGVSHASPTFPSVQSGFNERLDSLRAPKSGFNDERKNSDASEDVVEQFMQSRAVETRSTARRW